MGFTDLAILIYFFFFSSWFRNKVIGWISTSRTKEEGGARSAWGTDAWQQS